MERTTCSCQECIACCKRQPGPLIEGDMEKIAAALGESLEETKKHFWASPGALVKNMQTGRAYRVGTITPKFDRRRGRCVFLTDDDRCSIHAVAPFGCAYFDTHMGREEAQDGAAVLIRGQQTEAYQALRRELPFADSYRPKGLG